MVRNAVCGKIEFCDLKRQYGAIKDEIDNAVLRVLSSGYFILGSEVEGFEREFAAYCNTGFGIGVASGTEALYTALLACGIGPRDEVITVANAGVPTVCAITLTGARPVFADINPESFNIDISLIEEKITKRTKAILPVHLYGHCADMGPILKIAGKRNLKVIEDACQAHGAVYRGNKAGSMGDTGCFSFYPTKNLGAYGDGGMIVTKNKMLADRLRMLREYGQRRRYQHELRGINSRLDEIQASILRVKLKYLDKWNEARREIAGIYASNIQNSLIAKPAEMDYGTHVYHIYAVRCASRDVLKSYLEQNGIGAAIHYPKPVYNQKAYRELKGNLPATDKCADTVLSLPLFTGITKEEVQRVSQVLNNFDGG